MSIHIGTDSIIVKGQIVTITHTNSQNQFRIQNSSSSYKTNSMQRQIGINNIIRENRIRRMLQADSIRPASINVIGSEIDAAIDNLQILIRPILISQRINGISIHILRRNLIYINVKQIHIIRLPNQNYSILIIFKICIHIQCKIIQSHIIDITSNAECSVS